jgi:transposase InsO family protein
VRELTDLIAERGRPKMIVSDNGTEFTSNAVLAWSGDVGVEWHYIAPGRPTRDTGSSRASTVACATNC